MNGEMKGIRLATEIVNRTKPLSERSRGLFNQTPTIPVKKNSGATNFSHDLQILPVVSLSWQSVPTADSNVTQFSEGRKMWPLLSNGRDLLVDQHEHLSMSARLV